MGLSATPLHPLFAARITGVDLSCPIEEGLQHAIERAMDEHAVCVLPDQRLEDKQLIAFSQLYGPLEVSPPCRENRGQPCSIHGCSTGKYSTFPISMKTAQSSMRTMPARHTDWAISSGTPTARSGKNRRPGRCCTPA